MGNLCSGKREVRLVLIGLDLAGKTSLLNALKFGESGTTTPTVGFNFETVSRGSTEFNIWDTGGQDKIRDLWRHYYEEVDGVLFVLDSTDEQRLDEAKDELHKALRDSNLKDAFVCVVANKRDLADCCVATATIRDRMELERLPPGAGKRSWTLLEASALKGTGLDEVLDWAAKQA